MRARCPRTNGFARAIRQRAKVFLAAITIACVLSPALATSTAAAADDLTQVVTVVRDMTRQADCSLQINDNPLVCPDGTVVGDFRVTKAEAKAKGEAYVVRGSNATDYHAAVDRLIDAVHERYKARPGNGSVSPFRAIGVCGAVNVASGSYMAANFPSPQPRIGYEVRYFLSPNCTAVELRYVDTYWVATGSAAHVLRMTYDGNQLPIGGDCLDIPNQTNLWSYGAPANRDFYHCVWNQCGILYSTASGWTTIN